MGKGNQTTRRIKYVLKSPNKRINVDVPLRCASFHASYAKRYAKKQRGNKMKKSILVLFLSLYFVGCSSINRNVSNLLFPPYANSDQRQGEAVSLNLTYDPEIDRKTIKDNWKQCVAGGGNNFFGASIGAAAALQFAIEQVQQFLKEEAKRYTASYSAIGVGDHFYTSCEPATDIHLSSLNLTRSINNVPDAMNLSFVIEDSIDGTAFQIIPDKVQIKQSKAKIAAIDISRPFGFDILAPWTIFKINDFSELSPLRPNKVDLTVQVSITAVWVDKNEKGHNELIASRELKFSNITLGEEISLPDSAKQLFPAIPRSAIGNKYGLGNFVVSIMVTEYDDFAERILELEKGIEKNKDGLIKQFTDGI